MAPEGPLAFVVRRHAVAEALKLRVAAGNFLSLISPLGEMLTMAKLRVDVIQRSTLRVDFPGEQRLFNVFVNGESVNVVREDGGYQFYVLPGPDERSATVEFVYSSPPASNGCCGTTARQPRKHLRTSSSRRWPSPTALSTRGT